MKRFKGNYVFGTNIGRVRTSNEDNCIAAMNNSGDILLVVCDGMGGYKKGDYASNIVVQFLKEEFVNKKRFLTTVSAMRWISEVINKANRQIYDISRQRDFKNMGTTVVAALILKKTLIIVYAGDSRCYRYDIEKLEQLSHDQTFANYLYEMNQISLEEVETHERKHVLTNAIGTFPNCNLSILRFPYNGENIMLCSDGLYNNMPEKDILSCLNTNEDLNTKLETLFACANSNGGSDNMAVVLWEPEK